MNISERVKRMELRNSGKSVSWVYNGSANWSLAVQLEL
jgi:hypothetical protein